jgi:hypothetical protein
MSKLNLLILDANVIIHLHDIGIWDSFIKTCDIHLPDTVVEEAAFFDDRDEARHYIDLSDDISAARINTFTVPLSELVEFKSQFDSLYFDQLDPGELEALAYLCKSQNDFLISSGDAIVYRVLGRLTKGDQGISLEEILTKIGLQQAGLPRQFTKQFRESLTQQGFQDLMAGRGLK